MSPFISLHLAKNGVEFFAIRRKKYVQIRLNSRFFDHENYVDKSKWKQGGFFYQRNYIEKSTWKQHEFFVKKARGNNLDYSTIENYVEKGTWKRRGFFDQRNYIEK